MENVTRDRPPVCIRAIKISYEGKAFSVRFPIILRSSFTNNRLTLAPLSPFLCFQVSCFAVLENLSQLAVGLANGAVVFIRGDISRDRFTKQKVVHKGEHPITGPALILLLFCNGEERKSDLTVSCCDSYFMMQAWVSGNTPRRPTCLWSRPTRLIATRRRARSRGRSWTCKGVSWGAPLLVKVIRR